MSEQATIDPPAEIPLAPGQVAELSTWKHPNIHAALAAAQRRFPSIEKNAEAQVRNKSGEFLYSYKYATLDAILDTVRPILGEEELSLRHYIQNRSTPNGGAIQTIEAILTHVSGDELRSGEIPLPHWGSMQDLGGGMTYARRYTSNVLLAICPEHDDDAANTPGGNPWRSEEGQQGSRQSRGRSKANDDAPAAAPSGNGKKSQPPDSATVIKAIGNINIAAGMAKYLTERMGERPPAKSASGWAKIVAAVEKRLAEVQWTDEHKALVEAVLKTIRVEIEAAKHQPPPTGEAQVDDLFTRTQKAVLAAEGTGAFDAMIESWEASDDLLKDLPTFARVIEFAGHEIERRCGKKIWTRDDQTVIAVFQRIEALKTSVGERLKAAKPSNLF